MPAHEDSLLTTIITTSPTPSAPSTDLLSSVLLSFRSHCPGLLAGPVIVVLDAYDQVCSQPRLKKGQVTAAIAENYELYKANVRRLILGEYRPGHEHHRLVHVQGEAEYGSDGKDGNSVDLTFTRTEDGQVTFIEPSARLGFGLAVRSALRAVDTPYIWVHQHDWALLCDIPLGPLIEIMASSDANGRAPIKYVCFPAIGMLSYATSDHVSPYPALRQLTSSLKRNFSSASSPDTVVPLTPLFFWHDKPHIASTAHYLARIFPSRYAMRRGDFIEDKVGQRARNQMKEGLWEKWASWLYYPDDGKKVCLRHLKGRTWKGTAADLEIRRDRIL